MDTIIDADSKSVNALFQTDVQYQVPLYQRRYIWDNESWEVLWRDILDQESKEVSEKAKHFTGPIVTRRVKRQEVRFEIIDGQQRLMTFQLIFCVIRDLCKNLGYCKLKGVAGDHIKNSGIAIDGFRAIDSEEELPDPDYKFCASKYDESTFKRIRIEESEKNYGQIIHLAYDKNNKVLIPDIVNETRSRVFSKDEKVSLNILDAYDYFYEKIRNHIEEGYEEENKVDDFKEETKKKIHNLLEVIKLNFELVQITPGDSQQAEEIFESVNATGRKLSEFDYLRNNLFLRARDQSDEFYRKYWIFEDDPDSYDWNEERLESFFQAFLMAKFGPQILNKNSKLFDVYQKNLVILKSSLTEEFEELRNHAEVYKKMDDLNSEFGVRMQFYKDLSTFYTYEDEESYNPVKESQYNYYITVIRSFIMYLQQGLKRSEDEILSVFEFLESYVARSLLVDTVAGPYAYQAIRTFFCGLFLNQNEKFTIENMVDYLANNSKREWISNNVVGIWFSGKEYHSQEGWLGIALLFTERYIFYRIENWKRECIGEELLSFTKEKFPLYRECVKTQVQLSNDKDLWGSLGNLTYCWRDNDRQKFDTFDGKKTFLNDGQNSTLILNREICNEPDWHRDEIKQREQKLFSAFKLVWRDKTQFINTDIWKDIETEYSKGSNVEGVVVNIFKKSILVELKPGIEGIVHVSEMAWTLYEPEPSEIFRKGDIVIAKILEITEATCEITLSIKQTQPNPWEEIKKKYFVGSEVQGTVVEVDSPGATLQLEDGVEGMVKREEMGWFNRSNIHPSEIVKKGEKINVKILDISEEKGEILLSIKQTQSNPWTQTPGKYKIGSIVRGKIDNIMDYGAFAELEKGISGLIHKSELADSWFEKPEDVVSIGEELDLKVIKINKEKRQISLSLKALDMEPSRKPLNQNRRVKTENITPFGKSLEEAMRTKNTDKSKN